MPDVTVNHTVVLAGGGPTGLMLAGELALAGVDVAIVERRPSQQLDGSRAGGLHARTIEVLDQRGIAERFLVEGTRHPALHYHMIALNMQDMPTRHPYVLALWQNHIERLLADWVQELGVPIMREREVAGFTQDDAGVDVSLADGRSLRAEYLVGCDGGRSVVRKAAGIDFAGWDATTSWLIAEVAASEEPAWGFRHDERGTHALGKMEDEGRMRVVLTELHPRPDPERTMDDVREGLIAAYGTDFGVHSPTWISSFTDATRQAAAYRAGRVLLAGDAAHVHPPVGGLGLNLGVQDAVNLGWKLARVVQQKAPTDLLDSYHAERHPVGARVLRNTMAQVALRRQDDHTKALGETLTELLSMDEPRRHVIADMSGLGVRYDLGEGHPLLGRRMPDLELQTADGNVRVFTLLHGAQALLLVLGAAEGGVDRAVIRATAAGVHGVRMIAARYDGVWELPGVGAVAAASVVLVRPDGYVAWVREGAVCSLEEAVERCGC